MRFRRINNKDLDNQWDMLVKTSIIYIDDYIKNKDRNYEYLEPLQDLCRKPKLRIEKTAFVEYFLETRDFSEEIREYYFHMLMFFNPWLIFNNIRIIPLLLKKIREDGIIS